MIMHAILTNIMKGFSSLLIRYKTNLMIVHGDRIEPLACALSFLLYNYLALTLKVVKLTK